MKQITWVSDFFADELTGGAELADKAAIECIEAESALQSKDDNGYAVYRIKTKDLNVEALNGHSNDLFIISNFAQLQDHNILKYFIDNNIKYIHYSSDHSYCMYRNPFKHGSEMVCNCYPKDGPLHAFLNNAIAIMCQSQWHKQIWDMNVVTPRIMSIGSNLWSKDILNYIEKKLNEKIVKNDNYVIFESVFEHKNTTGAVQEAVRKGLKYELVKDLSPEKFIDKLIESKGIIFLPNLAESLSRIVVEARMCGCKVISNNLCGATKEEWFKLKEMDLVKFIRDEQPKRFMFTINTLYKGVMW